MIGYLRGRIVEASEGRAIVAVSASSDSDAGAIGYEVYVPARGPYLEWRAGQGVELQIHTHVREDALDLFGFLSREEKALFLVLLGVQGIGPRAAIGILSNVEGKDFVRAILEGDRGFLTSIHGVGKKKAERLIIDLADPIRKMTDLGLVAGASQGRGGPAGAMTEDVLTAFADARTALVGLGYREAQVQSALRRLMDDGVRPAVRAEDLIRTALREL